MDYFPRKSFKQGKKQRKWECGTKKIKQDCIHTAHIACFSVPHCLSQACLLWEATFSMTRYFLYVREERLVHGRKHSSATKLGQL